jgi:Tfp pilus assembly protein PilX
MTLVRRIASESGSALPAVVGVMLVVGILASVLHTTSRHVRQSTTEERAEKRAFQAAEAGLNVARYRLNKAMPIPTPTQCFTTVPVTTGGDCPQTTAAENMGSGASFRYTVTRVLTDTSTECDTSGLDFEANDYRCITSIGTSSGATRRVQAIVAAPRLGMFPVEGIFGLDSFTMGPGNLNGGIGSNETVTVASSVTGPYTVTVGPGGSYSGPSGHTLTTLPEDYVAPVSDAVFEATDGDQPGENNNSVIPYPLGSNREINVPSATGTVTLPPGTYNFCDVYLNGAADLRVVGPGPVRIFIDSPYRPGSGCLAGSGDFVANNSFSFTSSPPNPALLEMRMYGGPGTQFWLKNNSTFHGTLYAPRSAFKIDNASTVVGGVLAQTVNIQNFFTLNGNVPDGLTLATQVYESDGWTECVRTGSSTSAAGAGC